MIQYAKELNFQHQKNQARKIKLSNKIQERRTFIASQLGIDLPKYSHMLFDDPILLKLYFTSIYYQRVENRSIKSLSFNLSTRLFHKPENDRRDEVFEKVIRHFEKHGIKLRIKQQYSDYKITMTTLGL